jgi:hypothetical protein
LQLLAKVSTVKIDFSLNGQIKYSVERQMLGEVDESSLTIVPFGGLLEFEGAGVNLFFVLSGFSLRINS